MHAGTEKRKLPTTQPTRDSNQWTSCYAALTSPPLCLVNLSTDSEVIQIGLRLLTHFSSTGCHKSRSTDTKPPNFIAKSNSKSLYLHQKETTAHLICKGSMLGKAFILKSIKYTLSINYSLPVNIGKHRQIKDSWLPIIVTVSHLKQRNLMNCKTENVVKIQWTASASGLACGRCKRSKMCLKDKRLLWNGLVSRVQLGWEAELEGKDESSGHRTGKCLKSVWRCSSKRKSQTISPSGARRRLAMWDDTCRQFCSNDAEDRWKLEGTQRKGGFRKRWESWYPKGQNLFGRFDTNSSGSIPHIGDSWELWREAERFFASW